MGSWNATCTISNVPILDGEDIKLVFLTGTKFSEIESITSAHGYYRPDDVFSPAFLAVSGKYNDYGSIEDVVEDWNTDLIIKYIKNLSPQGIKYDDGGHIEDFTIEDLVKAIEREDLHINKDGVWIKSKLTFVMISGIVWNEIITKYEGDCFNYHFDDIDSYTIPVNVLTERIFKSDYENHQEFKKRLAELTDKDQIREMMMYDFGTDLKPHVFKKRIGDSSLLAYREYDEIYKANADLHESIYKLWSEQFKINHFLSATRKGWMVHPGLGSQDSDMKPYLILADIYKTVAKKYFKRWDLDGDGNEFESQEAYDKYYGGDE